MFIILKRVESFSCFFLFLKLKLFFLYFATQKHKKIINCTLRNITDKKILKFSKGLKKKLEILHCFLFARL